MPARRDEPDVVAHSDTLTISFATAQITFDRSSEPTLAERVTPGRPSVRLQFGRLGVGPDVSMQPAAVTAVIVAQSRSNGTAPNRWQHTTLRALTDWEPRLRTLPAGGDPVRAAVGAFTLPLLHRLYENGCTPVAEIPRW